MPIWYIRSEVKLWGGGTGKDVENHVQKNIGWILFKTHNIYIFLEYTIATCECEFGNYI